MDFLGFGNFFKSFRISGRYSHKAICLFIYLFEDLLPLHSAFAWLSLSPSYIFRFFSPGVILTTGATMFDSSSDSPQKWRGQREGLVHPTSNFNSV